MEVMRVVVVLAVASALLSSTVSGLKTHTDPDSYDSVAEARKAAEEELRTIGEEVETPPEELKRAEEKAEKGTAAKNDRKQENAVNVSANDDVLPAARKMPEKAPRHPANDMSSSDPSNEQLKRQVAVEDVPRSTQPLPKKQPHKPGSPLSQAASLESSRPTQDKLKPTGDGHLIDDDGQPVNGASRPAAPDFGGINSRRPVTSQVQLGSTSVAMDPFPQMQQLMLSQFGMPAFDLGHSGSAGGEGSQQHLPPVLFPPLLSNLPPPTLPSFALASSLHHRHRRRQHHNGQTGASLGAQPAAVTATNDFGPRQSHTPSPVLFGPPSAFNPMMVGLGAMAPAHVSAQQQQQQQQEQAVQDGNGDMTAGLQLPFVLPQLPAITDMHGLVASAQQTAKAMAEQQQKQQQLLMKQP